MSGTHAYLPPSGAGAWRYCAAWPSMNAKYPEAGDAPAAAEGDAAHWVNTQAVRNVWPLPGTRAPNAVAVTEEMLEGAEVWLDAIAPARSDDEHFERHVSGKRVHDSLNAGTPDYWSLRVTSSGTVLHVSDYKFGHGHVEAFENWQLVNYVALILDTLGVNGQADQMIAVEMQVVQPRSYHRDGPVRRWSVPRASDLRAHINTLRNAADRATVAEPVAGVGPHCKHCPGRHACQALHAAALSAVDVSTSAHPVELPPHAIGVELRALDRAAALLEARRAGLQEQALALIRRGERVPFYATEQGQGHERWNRPIAEVLAVGEAMGFTLGKPDAVTPAQARKLGMDPGIVAAFAERPTGALKLVADDGAKARRVFGVTT